MIARGEFVVANKHTDVICDCSFGNGFSDVRRLM
jgi:hypothetical protein